MLKDQLLLAKAEARDLQAEEVVLPARELED